LATAQVSSQFDLAVLGADDPLGESFLKALEESEVQVGRIFPLTMGEAEGIAAFRGEEWPCLSAEGFDFGQVQALVVASPLAAAQRVADAVRLKHPVMPILSSAEVVAAPAQAVARVLRVLGALAGVSQAEAFVTLPVAMAGRDGLDELVNQARGLFNMESPDPEVFPLQIAFNILPVLDGSPHRYEPSTLSESVRQQISLEQVGFSVVWAGVFYGASTALHAHLSRPLDADELRKALKHQEHICLMESDIPAGNPTPATDSAESADIFVGQIRADGNSVRMWLVYDPLRVEAVQMVAVIENWIEKPADSVLT